MVSVVLRRLGECLLPLAGVAVCLLIPPACQAQTYKPGDEIIAHFLGQWRPGVVLGTNPRGEVNTEIQFGSSTQRRVFPKAAIRFAYEADALARARFWSDASGKFRIKAALLAIDENEVTLRKDDMEEVKVAIDKLSDTDQSYLKRLQSEDGPATLRPPQPPPLEHFADDRFFGSAHSFGSDTRKALEPDPVPAYQRLKQGGVGFALDNFHDRIGTLIAVGGPDVWALATLENPFDVPTRLLWVSLARQKVENKLLLPLEERVLDYHPPSRRLLTSNSIEDGPRDEATLTLWEVSPTDKQVKPVVRWLVKTDMHTWGEAMWGYLIDGHLVALRSGRQEYVVWDTERKRAVYRVTQESFFAPEAVLSGGGKYLFIPEDKGVRILESATGKFLARLPSSDGTAGVTISEDGRHAAVLSRSKLTVWDLTSPDSQPDVHQAEAIGTPFTAKMHWVGNDRVMVEQHRNLSLFSLKSRIVLWNYEFDMDAVRAGFWGRTRDIVDGHLVYAATFGQGTQSGLAVGAVTLPGPRVDEAEANLDAESLYIVKAGTPVSIRVNCGEHNARVQKALEVIVQANGWVLDASSGIVLVAEMKRGEQQTVRYRMLTGGGGEQSATFTPYISSLQLKVGDAVAWQSGTSTGAPPVVSLGQGQSVQHEAQNWQRPHPEFFDNAKPPVRVMDPAKRNGLGATSVTNRGLIPK